MGKWQEHDLTEEFIKGCMQEQVPESELVNEKIEQAYNEIRRIQNMEMPIISDMGKRAEEKDTVRYTDIRYTDASQHTSATVGHRAEARYTTGRTSAVTKYTSAARRRSSGIKYTAAAVAVCLALAIFLVGNPTLAAQLPIIGHIFKDLEQNVSYPGDYSQHSAILPTETLSAETGKKKESQNDNGAVYQVKSGSITVTLTEVSYDSNGIYLAVLAENKDGFAPDAQKDPWIYLNCNVDMQKKNGGTESFREEYGNSLAYIAEGEFTDEHTFKGIVQLTSQGLKLSDYVGCDITFLQFRQELTTGKTMTAKPKGESEDITYMENDWKTYDGNWKFHLDFPDLKNYEKVVTVNQVNDQGFGIEKVVKTGYEIYAVPIIPDGKELADYIVTMWDADGKPLESHGSNMETRSIYGRDTSKVTVYILSWNDFVECKGDNSYLQPQKAVYMTTVDFSE